MHLTAWQYLVYLCIYSILSTVFTISTDPVYNIYSILSTVSTFCSPVNRQGWGSGRSSVTGSDGWWCHSPTLLTAGIWKVQIFSQFHSELQLNLSLWSLSVLLKPSWKDCWVHFSWLGICLLRLGWWWFCPRTSAWDGQTAPSASCPSPRTPATATTMYISCVVLL